MYFLNTPHFGSVNSPFHIADQQLTALFVFTNHTFYQKRLRSIILKRNEYCAYSLRSLWPKRLPHNLDTCWLRIKPLGENFSVLVRIEESSRYGPDLINFFSGVERSRLCVHANEDTTAAGIRECSYVLRELPLH